MRTAPEVVFTQGALDVPTEQCQRLKRAGVRLEHHEHMETSIPGIHAAGDLTTRLQGASMAAGAGTMAGAMMNHALNMENAATGLWPEG